MAIAADGDRVAITATYHHDGDDATYISVDAGQSWTTATAPEPHNYADLYVLASGRLVLMWSDDSVPRQLVVSAGDDWSELEKVNGPLLEPETRWGSKEFSVNRAGIAMIRVNNPVLDKI